MLIFWIVYFSGALITSTAWIAAATAKSKNGNPTDDDLGTSVAAGALWPAAVIIALPILVGRLIGRQFRGK